MLSIGGLGMGSLEIHRTRIDRNRPPAPVAPDAHRDDHAHTVQFYDDDAFLVTVVGEYLAGGLDARQPLVVIATPPHRKAFVARLRARGRDVAAERRSGMLVMLDARETLGKVMVDGVPDAARFRAVLADVIRKTQSGHGGSSLRMYGEMVDLLWKERDAAAANRLEELWNDLRKRFDFSLLCAYAMANFDRAADAEQFVAICDQHTSVAPTESYLERDEAGRLAEISLLQQRAHALEAEVRERVRLEQQLRDTVVAIQEREADLRDVLDNAAEGIHLVDADGKIEWANAAELHLLGYAAEEYIGRNIAEFHVDRAVIDDMLARLMAGETLCSREARLRHKDGSLRHVLVSSNVRWRDGKPQYTRCFTRDITDLRNAAEERERLLDRALEAQAVAEQANRAKSDFLAIMSHELRTPLNAIGGYAELMELGIHGPVSPQQCEALDRIQRSQRLLLGLINQVLNYAKIESGNIQYNVANVPLDESLRATGALVLPQLRAKELQFSYSGCDAGIVVQADGEKLQQIVLNLLSNAVKFTDRGGEVCMTAEPADSAMVIRVRDTGIGIAAQKLATIFDPFIQVDPHYTRTRDGVGLGLAISRDLARGMHGELSVESREGEGSTFALRIPCGAISS
jgi:PAS domain S-box-containing protein